MPRTDLTSATIQIMNTMSNGEQYTLKKISEKTELNFRTVQKVFKLIDEFQKRLDSKKINILHTKNVIKVQMKEKSGMTAMPIPIQKMLIRTTYYPTPNRHEELLVYLLQNNATSLKSSIVLEKSKIIEELVKAEHITKNKQRYFLSEMGAITARGAVSLYPELVK